MQLVPLRRGAGVHAAGQVAAAAVLPVFLLGPRGLPGAGAEGDGQRHLQPARVPRRVVPRGHRRGGAVLYSLTPPDPQLKGAWYPDGFNPCAYQVKTRFQSFPFKWVKSYRYNEDEPFIRALSRLEEEEWSNADILLVTDGEIRPPDEKMLADLDSAKETMVGGRGAS
jgi:hypothetical protein